MEQKNIFYLDKILPEPDKIFSFEYKSINEIITNCVFVLDTNVLFVPFETSEKNLDEIKKIFLKLKKSNRLFIPGRVAREFANNRAKKLGDLFLKIRQNKDKLNAGNFKIENYPLLHGNSSYQNLLENYNKIIELINSSRKLIEQVESDILSWNWNDNVSQTYKEIFTADLIKEVQKNQDDLIEDLKFRIEHKIAPGYKDSGKLDDGIGDLIVWQTAMEIARDENKDLILISNDQKNDWFYKQDRQGLYPKYELFDEFRRFTNGKSVQIVDFPRFLETQNANPNTVNEVKESIRKLEETLFSTNTKPEELSIGMLIEHKLFGWGNILRISKDKSDSQWIDVKFHKYGIKRLLLKLAPIRIYGFIDDDPLGLFEENNETELEDGNTK